MKYTPWLLKFLLNLYPPYLGAGVRVSYIANDWKELHVTMACRWFNRNAVNTHFGGSLYSMIDPHLMLLLMQLLGKDYLIWDKAASIEFVKASRKRVTSVIQLSDQDLEDIRANTRTGNKYLPEFKIELRDEDNELIARVNKTIYVRRKSIEQSSTQMPVAA
jgi:acyl-coenzyme A thioesterase PaaI-like protein